MGRHRPDRLIDIGRGSRDASGEIIATVTPEIPAETDESYPGESLKPILLVAEPGRKSSFFSANDGVENPMPPIMMNAAAPDRGTHAVVRVSVHHSNFRFGWNWRKRQRFASLTRRAPEV